MTAIRQIVSPLMWAVVVICLPCAAQSAQVNSSQNASISGTVQSEAGTVEYARVSVYQVVTSQGWARLARRCSVGTDSKGSYQCEGLTAGKYYVIASGGELPEKPNKKKEQANPYAFFPSATDLENAGEIVVGAGQLQSADILVGSGELHTVSCKIANTARYAHARLLARSKGRDGTLLADTGIRGIYDEKRGELRFEGVPAGSFEAVARWRYGDEFHFSEAEVSVQSADVRGIPLEEQRPVSVEGTVTVDPGGSDAKTALSTVVLERGFEANDFAFESASLSAPISRNGSFHFSSVTPGRYFLKIESDPQVFVESSTIGGLNKNGSLVVIGGGAENLTIQVDASAEVGSIGGVVADLPEGGAKAGVLVQQEETGQVFTTSADQGGKYMVTGLGPGDYRIYSWTDLAHMAYRDPSVLNQYADSAASIILQSGAMNQIVNVNLIQSQ